MLFLCLILCGKLLRVGYKALNDGDWAADRTSTGLHKKEPEGLQAAGNRFKVVFMLLVNQSTESQRMWGTRPYAKFVGPVLLGEAVPFLEGNLSLYQLNFSFKMNYGFIDSLKQQYRVTEMNHAFRINGVVDVWKNGKTVYEKEANKYHKPENEKELESLVVSILSKTPEQPDFKPTTKGNVSYQQFKHGLKNSQYAITDVKAEDYHWGQCNLETSEDHLYFAVVDDNVKIGRSKNPKTRMKSMDTGMYKRPKVYVFNNKGFMETKMHHLFSDFRIKGEWFKFDYRIQHFLKKHHSPQSGYILWPKEMLEKNQK
jgi:hypothetical protein